ncbi:MAG: hypothetical protein LBT79_07310 [Elusimicrobiota bacterium]|nr:hypothetical protein [Elusimicrobiota bacterium]
MYLDIAIIVFALIGIFTKKRWAVITATICFIVNSLFFIVGFTIGLTAENSVFEDFQSEIFEGIVVSFVILYLTEIAFIIIGWVRILKGESKGNKD